MRAEERQRHSPPFISSLSFALLRFAAVGSLCMVSLFAAVAHFCRKLCLLERKREGCLFGSGLCSSCAVIVSISFSLSVPSPHLPLSAFRFGRTLFGANFKREKRPPTQPPLASLPAAHHLRLSFSLFLSLPHTHTHTWMFPSPTTSAHSRGPLQLLSAVLYLWRELGIRREEEKAANEVVAGRAQPATDPSPRQLPLRSGKAAHPAQAPFVFPSPVCVRVCVRVEKKKTRRGGKRRRRRRREWAKCVWCV